MKREQAEQIARKHADLRSNEPRGEDALTLTHAINAIMEAAAFEREACAKHIDVPYQRSGSEFAEAIRARGER